MVNQPLLSIIITSYTTERLKDIFEVLNSIKNQVYRNIEVVFVVERSKGLHQSIKTYAREIGMQNLRAFFLSAEIGISGARNIGITHAHGDIIAFTDDDAVLLPNWAQEITLTLTQRHDIIGVTGPVLPLWENESMKWFPEEFYWMIGCTAWKGLKGVSKVDYAWGVNMAFRKEAFEATLFRNRYAKGAHEEGKLGPVGDDIEFSRAVCIRTGKHILYNPNAKVLHKVNAYKLTSKFIRRYSYWQGYSDAMHKSLLSDIHSRSKTESSLLHRIIRRLVPSILRGFVVNRRLASLRLKVTIEALSYFSFGYLSYLIPGLPEFLKD